MICIAIDDEPIALSVIKQFCSRIEGMEITTFTDPLRGIAEVKSKRPDLLFLDIEMGSINGVELAREVPPEVQIIFTTAYAQFALDGFDLGVTDFLHKPFSFPRFQKAIARAEEQMELRRNSATESATPSPQITVRVEYRNISIDTAQITHIESMDNYIKISLKPPHRPILTLMSLKGVEEQLPSESFIRIHKSYIVARQAITQYTRTNLSIGDIELPIGRSYMDMFQQWI